jgi:hypothetical protein
MTEAVVPDNAAHPRAHGLARLVLHQFRFDLLAFVRNRQSQFFTLVLPVLFLVILLRSLVVTTRSRSQAGG